MSMLGIGACWSGGGEEGAEGVGWGEGEAHVSGKGVRVGGRRVGVLVLESGEKGGGVVERYVVRGRGFYVRVCYQRIR